MIGGNGGEASAVAKAMADKRGVLADGQPMIGGNRGTARPTAKKAEG
jgi:hypothetical protein